MARIRRLIALFPVSPLAFKGPQFFFSKLANDSDRTQIDCTLFPTCRRHVVYCTHLDVSVCPYESVTPNAGSWRSLQKTISLSTAKAEYWHTASTAGPAGPADPLLPSQPAEDGTGQQPAQLPVRLA